MNTFSELISQEKLTLVDFSAEWCGPCKMLKPILSELKGKIGESANIIKVDIDKSPQTAKEYNIRAVPTLILFKNGNIVWRQTGALPANKLEEVITKYLN